MNTAPQIILTNEIGTSKEQLWKEHAKRQKESGLSRIAYCRKHQLNYDHFGYWARKWRQEAAPSSKLIPIHLNKPIKIALETVCTLALKNGGELKIHDKTLLPMLLSLLR